MRTFHPLHPQPVFHQLLVCNSILVLYVCAKCPINLPAYLGVFILPWWPSITPYVIDKNAYFVYITRYNGVICLCIPAPFTTVDRARYIVVSLSHAHRQTVYTRLIYSRTICALYQGIGEVSGVWCPSISSNTCIPQACTAVLPRVFKSGINVHVERKHVQTVRVGLPC